MTKPKPKTIDDAIAIFGSERGLANATGYSQHAIWKARAGRLARGISAEMALAIQTATRGAVPAKDLRPDLFKTRTAHERPTEA